MPFATMEDLAEGTFVPYDGDGDAFYNSVETRRTLLAPRIIEFRERGRIVQGDHVLLYTYMTVTYYDTLLPLLARLLAPAPAWTRGTSGRCAADLRRNCPAWTPSTSTAAKAALSGS